MRKAKYVYTAGNPMPQEKIEALANQVADWWEQELRKEGVSSYERTEDNGVYFVVNPNVPADEDLILSSRQAIYQIIVEELAEYDYGKNSGLELLYTVGSGGQETMIYPHLGTAEISYPARKVKKFSA